MTPARAHPIALAQANASARACPLKSFSTASKAGTPRPALNSRRTICPNPFGATITTSTLRRDDSPVNDGEPVSKEKRLSTPQIRRDLFRKNLRHFCVRQGEKNNVASPNRFRWFQNSKFVSSRPRTRLAAAAQSDHDFESVVAEI